MLHLQLREDEWKQHQASLVEHSCASHHRHGQLPYREGGLRGVSQRDPDGEQGDGEEVVEERQWLSDDACEKADGAVDA